MKDNQKSWLKKILFFSCLLLFTGSSLFFGGFYFIREKNKALAEKELQHLVKEGYLTSLAEIEQICGTVSSSENAAFLYREAFLKLVEIEKNETESRGRKNQNVQYEKKKVFIDSNYALIEPLELQEPIPEDLKETIQNLLNQNQEALALIQQATLLKKARYCSDMKKGFNVELVNILAFRQVVNFLGLKAVFFASQGDAENATKSLLDSLAISRSITHEPFLVHYFLYCYSMDVFLAFLEQVLNRVSLSEEQLTLLSTTLENMSRFELGLSASEIEICTGFELFESEEIRERFFYSFSGQLDQDKLIYLQTMKANLDLFRTPLSQRFHLIKNWPIKTENHQSIWANPAFYALIDFKRFIINDLILISVFHNMRIALEIERYRLVHHTVPERLADLVPQYLDESYLLDFCDGKPLRYQKKEKGYLLYSVGPDSKDEGGEVDKERRNRYDIVFRMLK